MKLLNNKKNLLLPYEKEISEGPRKGPNLNFKNFWSSVSRQIQASMGRKSEKSKVRVKKRKEEKLKLLAAQDALNKANNLEDPLADFPAFRLFEKNGIKAYIECHSVDDIDSESFQAVFKLEKNNMESIYNSCSWGWNEEKKYKEMTEKTAKYLVARNDHKEIIGFSHFRFDMDYGSAVLYCYELQLDPKIRRRGLGKFLLQVLELIAFKNNMKKVVLTVLKHNLNAVNFFYSLKYEIDETNPEEGIFEVIPYQILSKINKKFPAVMTEELKK